MTRVAITSLISGNGFGLILGATAEDGCRLRVRTQEGFDVDVGDVLEVDGHERSFSDQHGVHIQIEATHVSRARTVGALVIPWLCTLPGIGQTRARRLVDLYGDSLLDVMRDSRRLDEVAVALSPNHSATGKKLARRLFVELASRDATEDVGMAEGEFMRRLEALGVEDLRAARRLWRLIGSVDAYERIVAKPYITAVVLPWERADAIGRSLLAANCPPEDVIHHPDRLVGAVDAVWKTRLARGSTAAAREDFEQQLQRMNVTPGRAIRLATERHRTIDNGTMLRAPGAAHLERIVAGQIHRIRSSPTELPVARASHSLALLNDEQRAAIAYLTTRSFAVLHGGAGVGKTTTMKAMCDLHEAAGWNVVLCAIAGKAALRLSRATGRIAYTVARLLLEIDAGKGRLCTSDDTADVRIDSRTVVVVDEASMVDLVSWSRLLDQVPNGARIVVVGDPGQLPPVGLGRVFHDLVEQNVDVFQLKTVVRQGEGNPIIAAAADVRAGRVPEFPEFEGKMDGVFHLECGSDDIEATALIVREELSRGETEDMLMMAARNVTCTTVTRAIQKQRFDVGVAGIRLGPLLPWVSVGEPVVATVNRYAEALTNGLIGIVTSLDPPMFLFDGERYSRPISDAALWEIVSAWCVTVHRAQGSEADRIVILLDSPGMMNREWLYTAITRATKQVVLVGPRERLRAAVSRMEKRVTGMQSELARDRSAPPLDRPRPVSATARRRGIA